MAEALWWGENTYVSLMTAPQPTGKVSWYRCRSTNWSVCSLMVGWSHIISCAGLLTLVASLPSLSVWNNEYCEWGGLGNMMMMDSPTTITTFFDSKIYFILWNFCLCRRQPAVASSSTWHHYDVVHWVCYWPWVSNTLKKVENRRLAYARWNYINLWFLWMTFKSAQCCN